MRSTLLIGLFISVINGQRRRIGELESLFACYDNNYEFPDDHSIYCLRNMADSFKTVPVNYKNATGICTTDNTSLPFPNKPADAINLEKFMINKHATEIPINVMRFDKIYRRVVNGKPGELLRMELLGPKFADDASKILLKLNFAKEYHAAAEDAVFSEVVCQQLRDAAEISDQFQCPSEFFPQVIQNTLKCYHFFAFADPQIDSIVGIAASERYCKKLNAEIFSPETQYEVSFINAMISQLFMGESNTKESVFAYIHPTRSASTKPFMLRNGKTFDEALPAVKFINGTHLCLILKAMVNFGKGVSKANKDYEVKVVECKYITEVVVCQTLGGRKWDVFPEIIRTTPKPFAEIMIPEPPRSPVIPDLSYLGVYSG